MRTLLVGLTLFGITSLSSQAMTRHQVGVEPSPLPEISPVAAVSPVPSPLPAPTGLNASVGVSLEPSSDSTGMQKILVAEAQEKMTRAVASECFSKFLLAQPLVQTNGRTPAQVLDHLRSLRGVCPVQFYQPSWFQRLHNNVLGYEIPGDPQIYLNATKFVGAPACEVASTAAHECLGHALGGYSHDFQATSRRPYSVPYTISSGVDACCL